MSLRIGIDLDGVAYDFTKKFVEVARGKGYDLSDTPDCWNWFEECGMSRQQFEDLMHFSVDDLQLFWRGDVLDDAAQHISALKDAGHEIHIVTHRTSGYLYSSEQATEYWLGYKGFRYDSLTFSADKTVVPVDVFIEDNLDNYDALEAAGIKAYLVNRPYNQVEGDGRRRVNSFAEFANLFLPQKAGV